MRAAQVPLFGVLPAARETAALDELLEAAIAVWPERGTWCIERGSVQGTSATITNRGPMGLCGSAWSYGASSGGRQVIEDNRLSPRELVAELRSSSMALSKALAERTGDPWVDRVECPHRAWLGPWRTAGLTLGDGAWLVAKRVGRTTKIIYATQVYPFGWEVASGRLVALDLSRVALARKVRRSDPGGARAVELLLGRQA